MGFSGDSRIAPTGVFGYNGFFWRFSNRPYTPLVLDTIDWVFLAILESPLQGFLNQIDWVFLAILESPLQGCDRSPD
jgi:hypothetical protein